MARHAAPEKQKPSRALPALVAVLAVVLLAACACAAVLLLRPSFALPVLQALGVEPAGQAVQTEPAAATAAVMPEAGDREPTEDELTALQESPQATPLIAQCEGVDLRSGIEPANVTGVLFHQASYEYALVMETQLPEADYETVADSRTMRVNNEQVEGDWLDADALHVWRTGDATEMDTSIDLGALPGTTILSPVDGTVVLVRDYLLYDEMPDVEIHIQPEGRSDLDVVLIHTTNVAVKAGDRVQAGVTPLAEVRNIEEFLTDVQLAFFLPEGVGGNHVHIQVNDADYPDYRENRLEGAVTVQ